MPEQTNQEQPEAKSQTPNDELAEMLVDELRASGLLLEGRRATALERMTSGKVSQDDWRIWAEDLVLDEHAEAEETDEHHTD